MTDAPPYEWFRPGGHDAELPHHRDPRTYGRGLYHCDNPETMTFELSFGEFLWFSSRREMATYIREVEPQIYYLQQDELDAYRASVERVLARMSDPDPDWEAMRADINAAQEKFRVVWWGRFESVCSGSGDFELEFRRQFSRFAASAIWLGRDHVRGVCQEAFRQPSRRISSVERRSRARAADAYLARPSYHGLPRARHRVDRVPRLGRRACRRPGLRPDDRDPDRQPSDPLRPRRSERRPRRLRR